MTQATAEHSTVMQELERFLIVAEAHQGETGQPAFMPACPIDGEWHRLLEDPDAYRGFCHSTVGHDVPHRSIKGEGVLVWSAVYEKLYGKLPEIWFCDAEGNLNQTTRQQYLDTGVFRASWDCGPY